MGCAVGCANNKPNQEVTALPKEAKNNETTKVELDYTTPPAQQTATKRTNTNRTDANQTTTKRTSTKQTAKKRTDPSRTEHAVDGNNETERAEKTKRTTKKRTGVEVQLDYTAECAANPTHAEPKRSSFDWDGVDRSGPTCGTATVKGGIHQSAREMIEKQQAIASGEKKLCANRNPQEQMVLAANEGPTADMLAASIELFNMPRVDLEDEWAVRERITEFFEVYAKRGLKPTVAGLGLALGLDRRRLWEIKTGAVNTRQRTWPKGTQDSIRGAYVIMESLWESYMVGGKLNPVTGIFLAKNQYGYVDRMDHVVAPNVEEQQRSAEDIRRRYISAADEDTIEIED